MLAFWLANTTELLHFFQQDPQLKHFANDFETSLSQIIHLAYKHFVTCLIKEMQVFLPAFYDDSNEADSEEPPQQTSSTGYTSGPENAVGRIGKEQPDVVLSSRASSKVSRHGSLTGSHWSVSGSKVQRRGRSTIGDLLQLLNSTVTVLKTYRVNATLSIMVFSNLFRYISVRVFNRLVSGEVKHCGRALGKKLSKRLERVKVWAEREGMELPAETHLTTIVEV